MRILLRELDHEYWMQYAGFDGNVLSAGYSYLVFQRTMIRAFLIYFVGNIVFLLATYLAINIYETSGS